MGQGDRQSIQRGVLTILAGCDAPAAVEGEADVRDSARKVMELYSDKILDTGPLGTVIANAVVHF